MINKIFIIILIFLSIYCEQEKLNDDDKNEKSYINENNTEDNSENIKYINAKIDEVFTLYSNYTAIIESDNIEVHCRGISDSRCPPNVVCIWEGDVSILLDIKVGQIYNYSFGLSLTEKNYNKKFNQYIIKVVGPDLPFTSADISFIGTYSSASLIISRNEI